MRDNKGFVLLIVVCVAVAVIALVAVMFNQPTTGGSKPEEEIPIACTLEAKLCPDGSYVGRDASLNCEFSPCPTPE